MVADGSTLDRSKTLHDAFQNRNKGLGLLVEQGDADIFNLSFSEFLYRFCSKLYARDTFRPIPPMLGNGHGVDLLKLFLVVKEKGECDSVSEDGLWDKVAEEMDLGSDVWSLLKLVHAKYLHTLDLFLVRILKDKKLGSGSILSVLLMELEEEFNKKGKEYPNLDSPKKNKLNFVNVKRFYGNEGGKLSDEDDNEVTCLGSRRVVDRNHENGVLTGLAVGKKFTDDDDDDDDDDNDDDADDDVVILDPAIVNSNNFSRKRKRGGTFLGLLNWVTQAAKDPCDPVIKTLPDISQWKSHGCEELWKQALLAREVLFSSGTDSTAELRVFQKKQRMHPSMYDDQFGSGNHNSEKLRFSQRLLSVKKSQPRACLDSSGIQNDTEDIPADSFNADSGVLPSWINTHRKRIPIPLGPCFQAEVPEWSGVAFESDCKWVGTRVWPTEKGKSQLLIEREPMGKGRKDSCSCEFQNSIECVRFHVGEKRKRLNLELGSAFNSWKIDKMGESVANSWTEEDKKKFNKAVKSTPPSSGMTFWDDIFEAFPTKSREDLVSYYCNVFLLQRRAFQNRCTPCNINSDDDEESEIGPSTNGSGPRALKSPGTKLCAQRKPALTPSSQV